MAIHTLKYDPNSYRYPAGAHHYVSTTISYSNLRNDAQNASATRYTDTAQQHTFPTTQANAQNNCNMNMKRIKKGIPLLTKYILKAC